MGSDELLRLLAVHVVRPLAVLDAVAARLDRRVRVGRDLDGGRLPVQPPARGRAVPRVPVVAADLRVLAEEFVEALGGGRAAGADVPQPPLADQAGHVRRLQHLGDGDVGGQQRRV